jgi:CDP-diacylglycerol---serine O-phosphatidyltransferase
MVEQPKQNKRKSRELSLRSLIPNVVTTLSLCLGLWAIRLGFDGQFAAAVLVIIAATFLDALDGSLARLLKSTSKLGGELDSLADFLSFGVAPVLVLYSWAFAQGPGLGWIAILAYSICSAMRLARFNVMMLEEGPELPLWQKGFFVGVPAPAGAGIAMLPFYLHFSGLFSFDDYPIALATYIGAVAFLMVSTFPSFSLKKLRLKRKYILVTLVLVAVTIAFLQAHLWVTLTILSFLYLLSIPIACMKFRKLRQQYETSTQS